MCFLFIVTSYWAYGELAIACEFAKRVEKVGGQVHFLVPPTHQKTMKSWGFGFTTLLVKSRVLNVILLKDIESRLRPKVVILADFLNYNFCEAHYGLTYKDLEIFSGKIGTFDDFDWVKTKDCMDTYGFKAKRFAEIDIRKYGFGLCPCPIVNPIDAERENTFFYRLTDRKLPYCIGKTDEYKRKLDIPTGRKVILYTNAVWQDNYKNYNDVQQFVEVNQAIFWHLMERLAKKYTIICIGKESYYKKKTENIIFIDSVPPDVFDQYILATDLFLSRNVVSTSLARAVLSGVPSVCIQNSIRFKRDVKGENSIAISYENDFVNEQLNKLQRSYKYRMFPVGWYYFLQNIYDNNPYFDTFYQVEQYDIEHTMNTIASLLENRDTYDRLRLKLEQYESILNRLPDIAEITNHLLGGREI
ncbi:MAG: hypothetical protein HFG36_01200 [Eubacterium sp.]|nr:hypothetical protein [Eubacterium sp.]